MKISIRILIISLLLFGYLAPIKAQFQTLSWQEITPSGYPSSIKVYETNTPYADSTAFHAVYTIFDLNDKTIGLKMANVGSSPFRNPVQHSQAETDSVYMAINAGFFSATSSVSLAIDNYIKSANSVFSLSRPGPSGNVTFFPSRAAFALSANRTPSIFWSYNIDSTGNPAFKYPTPGANHETNLVADLRPTSLYPSGASLLQTPLAIGGGPVILKDSLVFLTHEQEVLESSVVATTRQPRTAIGYTNDGKLIFVVVDGRQPGFATGIDLANLAQLFRSLGAVEAMNLDGGGSSAMVINNALVTSPSDPGNVMRNVPTAVLLMKRPIIYDTEDTQRYAQSGSWSETSNAGQYGPSRTRIGATNPAGSNKAWYKFKDLAPGQYRLEAWWNVSGAPNRSTNAPYVLQRNGLPNADTVRLNQTLAATANRFNSIGTYHIGPEDSLMISTDALGNFVGVDAIGLVKVGESLPITTFTGADSLNLLVNNNTNFQVFLSSPNTGVLLDSITIYKSVNGGAETIFSATAALNNTYADTITFNYTATDPAGVTRFRFEVRDHLGRTSNRVLPVRINPFQLQFIPTAIAGRHERNDTLALQLEANTFNTSINLDSLQIFKSVNNGALTQLGATQILSGSIDTINFSQELTEMPTDKVAFLFRVFGQNGSAELTYTATIEPQRGDFRMAVIADFNSAFGSTTYEWQVDSIMERIPRIWNPDLVISGGDMIAGQSASLTPAQVDAMWAGFDAKIATPLRNANIPFVFTLGNHDGAIAVDKDAAVRYWSDSTHWPGGFAVDTSNFPFYHSFMEQANGDFFFVSWDNAAANVPASVIAWMDSQFASPLAQAAKYRFLIGHMPLYGVSPERASPGNVVANADGIRNMLEMRGVHTYISGHHHAYYPGKRGNVDLLNAGAIGSGARAWIGIDKAPVNTVTIMDVFSNPDTIVYTTYDIRHRDENDMTLFEIRDLPEAIFSFNGFTVRRDIEISGNAAGMASAVNLTNARPEVGTAAVSLTEAGNQITLTGTFNNLEGRILDAPDAIGIYQAIHSENGALRFVVPQITSTDGKNGTFAATLNLSVTEKEMLSTGALYLTIRTDSFPNGEIRSQLYKNTNQAPSKPVITSPSATSAVSVRDILALLPVSWSTSKDPETNPVTYLYELAIDSNFNQIILSESMGKQTSFRSFTEGDWFNLIDTVPIGQEVIFYHRVLATDGKNINAGNTTTLRLKRSIDPVIGSVEIPAPDFVFDASFEKQASAANGHGIAVDAVGKVWAVAFGGRVRVYNPDGSNHIFTSTNVSYNAANDITAWNFNGTNINAASLRGAGRDNDGNILLTNANGNLVKVDYVTGNVIATRNSGTSLSNFTVDTAGRVFAASVTGNAHFLWKQNDTLPSTYDTIRNSFNIGLRPAVIRAAAISREGNTIYLPNEGGQNMFIYGSNDGLNFELDTVLLTGSNAKCNSIYAGADSTVWYVTNSSVLRAILHFRDFRNNLSYQYELKEVTSNDLRGLAFTTNMDTFYVIGSDNGRISRYYLPQSGGPAVVIPNILAYNIGQVKGINAQGVADSLNRYVRLGGVVQSKNLSRTGSEYFLSDITGNVLIKNSVKNLGSISKGDSVFAFGWVRQQFGMIFIETDSVQMVSTNNALNSVTNVSQLSEVNESAKVSLDSLEIINATDWSNSGYAKFELAAIKGNDTINLQVRFNADLFTLPAPGNKFTLSGFVIQEDFTSPFTSSYILVPVDTQDVKLITEVSISAIKDSACLNDNLSFLANLINAGTISVSEWLVNGVPQVGASLLQFNPTLPVGSGVVSHQVTPQGGVYPFANAQATSSALPYTVLGLPTPNLGADTTMFTSQTLTLNPGTGFAQYLWSDASTSSSLVITGNQYQPGTYPFSVMVTDSFGCMNSDSIEVAITFPTSTNNLSELSQQLNVFPNPAKSNFNVEWKGVNGAAILKIWNLQGGLVLERELILSEGPAEVQVGNLSEGVYLLELRTIDKQQRTKLIIKK